MAAKAKRGRKKGQTKENRIEVLTAAMSKTQVKQAATIAKETPYDVLKLAWMTAVNPKARVAVAGLGTVINELDDEKKEKARELIAAIKAL